MKYILIALLLFSTAYGQTIINGFTPAGITKAYMPGTSFTGSSALTTIYADTLPENVLVAGRKYEYTIYCSLTTPALLLPTLTLTVWIGNTSMTLAASSLLSISLTKKPFKIHVITFANTGNAQFIYAEVLQDGGTLTLGSNYFAKNLATTEDMTVSKIMKVTAQFSVATGLSGTTLYVDNVYKEPF